MGWQLAAFSVKIERGVAIVVCVLNVWRGPCFYGSLSRGSKKGVILVLKLGVSISSKADHDSLVSSKMEKPW